MENEKKDEVLPRFGIGIHTIKLPDGRIGYELKVVNQGIPMEVALAQIKALLKKLEEDYYNMLFKLKKED